MYAQILLYRIYTALCFFGTHTNWIDMRPPAFRVFPICMSHVPEKIECCTDMIFCECRCEIWVSRIGAMESARPISALCWVIEERPLAGNVIREHEELVVGADQ